MKVKKLIAGLLFVTALIGFGSGKADASITSDMKDLEVEIKYGNKEVEFEYEVKSRGVSASYKNELTGERMSGTAAQAKIEALMASVDVRNDARETIASKIASQVSSQNYTRFSLESEFTSRYKVEFKLSGQTTTTPTPTPVPTSITDFEVEIEYGRNSKIELDYEVKNSYIQAKYRNTFTGEYLTGASAQAKIEAIMNGMDYRNASRSQIISYLLGQLGAGNDYRDFDFEVKYSDRQKIEF